MRSLTLYALLAVGLTACGGGDDAPTETTEAEMADATRSTADGSTAGTSAAGTSADRAEPSRGADVQTSGELEAGDETLESGEYADRYPVTVRTGQTVVVDATTDGGLDPYVMLIAPSKQQVDNDDHEGSATHARIEHEATESGSYIAVVTSYEPGETGTYDVEVTVRD